MYIQFKEKWMQALGTQMSLDDIKVGLVGHLAIGQTVSRSLADLLANVNKVKIYFVAPDVVKMNVGSLGFYCHEA